MDIDEILKRKQPRTRTVKVLLDDSLQLDRDRLVYAIKRAEIEEAATGGDWSSQLPAQRQRLVDLDVEIHDKTVSFTFKAIPRPEWDALVEEYIDDPEQDVSDEFMIAVVAASSIDSETREPNMTLKQAEKLWTQWGSGETDQLYLTAFKANREVRDIPFTDADTNPTRSIGSNSNMSDQEASPTQSS